MPKKSSEQKPQSVGQYYIMEKIAQGGMAEIFRGLAYDVHGIHQKSVCIKKILPHLSADRDFIGSIIDEAKLAVRLVHGNIAQTFDLGKVGDDYYMVMEYVEGATLSQINRRCLAQEKRIPIPILAYFISEVAQGLDYMHRRTDEDGKHLHIVHRDISPQNIMVSYAGTVKIIDFGIAKAAFKAGQTDSGMLKGKFAYMSPEQSYGDAIDHRSDIFSLGIILHEMLTGKRLFKADDNRQTIRNVRKAFIDPPSTENPDVPEELNRITMKALSKDRRFRYAFASEMRDDLIKFLHHDSPDFTSGEAAAFMQELFREEMLRPHKGEADSKTPALIIDRSNSALADDSQFEVTGKAKAPLDLEEFMLEEESKEEMSPPEQPQEEISESETLSPSAAVSAEEEEGATTSLWRRWRPTPKQRLMIFSTLFIVSLLTLIGIMVLSRKAPDEKMAGSQAAELMVITQPSDALVAFDGHLQGQGSPITIRNIAPENDHLLVVSRDGFTSQTQRLKLKAGEFRSVTLNLTSSTPPPASLEILSDPSGATVYLDDAQTPHHTPATITPFDTAKEHTIGLFAPGYKFWSKRINLKDGESKSLEITLSKNFGSALIESDPPGALIVLDGTPIGQTPLTREQLEPDRIYHLEIWLEGFEPLKRDFKAKPGMREEIRVTLHRTGSPETGKGILK